MRRDYQDTKLIRYFENQISKMKVKDDYKPLLVDILLRRAHEFSLSPMEIEQDVQSLLNSLQSIEIRKMPKDDRNTIGLYDYEKKKIILNVDFVRNALKNGKNEIDELYVTLTHEVYHALSIDENGNDRLESKNSFTGKPNSNLLETIIETAANRTVLSRTEKDRYNFKKETNGYTEMTFVVPVLAATYGVSEKEFLKHAIFGRNKLIRFLSSKVKEPPFKTIEFLDLMELNLGKIHNAIYLKRKKPITKKRRSKFISEAMFSISHICNCKLEQRYASQVVNDSDAVYNFVENAKYNHIRLHQIIDREMKNLDKEFGINTIPLITELKEESDYDEQRTIIEMDSVVQARQNFQTEAEYLKVFDIAKRGCLSTLDEDYLKSKNLADSEEKTLSSVDESVIKKFDDEDFQIEIPWNNACINHYISKYISKLVPRRGLVSFISDTIEEMIYGKVELSPKRMSSKDVKTSEVFRLSNEDLEKFNMGTKRVLTQYKKISSKEKNEGEFVCSKT